MVRVVALPTDLATDDVMHRVLLRTNPEGSIVDVCHDIASQDMQAAALKVGCGVEVVLDPVEDLDQPRIDRLRR